MRCNGVTIQRITRASCSCFNDTITECAQDHLLFRSDVFSDKHHLRAIGFKWLQFPAARHEIEELPAVSEGDETLGANDARRQALRKVFKTISRENFAGSECERFEFRLMLVARSCDSSLVSNSK